MAQEAAAELGAAPPLDLDADWRADLTAHRVLTIDDASTTEIDDGLSVERGPDGALRLWVHIADPSRWVGFGDDLDVEAARRSKSTYLPTGELSLPAGAPRVGSQSAARMQVHRSGTKCFAVRTPRSAGRPSPQDITCSAKRLTTCALVCLIRHGAHVPACACGGTLQPARHRRAVTCHVTWRRAGPRWCDCISPRLTRAAHPAHEAEALPHWDPVADRCTLVGHSVSGILARDLMPLFSCAGSVADYKVVPSLVRPARRLTYHEVDAALGGGPAVGEADDQATLLALQQVLYPGLRSNDSMVVGMVWQITRQSHSRTWPQLEVKRYIWSACLRQLLQTV